VLPGAKVDFLEAMLQWHVGNSTSADLVLRDVQDAIVSEVTSFPVDKVALGESPSVAMHVPVPTLRQSPDGGPCSSQELGAAAMKMNGMNEDEKSGMGGNKDDSCDYASGEALVAGFPRWAGWTQPATALTLRAVLMTASALTAAAGMRQASVIGDQKARSDAKGGPLLKPQILFPEPTETLGDLREFFETLWPDAPYSFGTYGKDSVSSDDRYLKGEGTNGRQKKREKRLVIVVNVSSPGEESAAESDGEGMVNAAETLLELNVPFVVLTLWQDNSLVKSVQTQKPRAEERDALRVLMERRTRILLGRSVKRKEARGKIRDAYARAKKMPQGSGYVALEEALAEARATGADTGSEGEAMLAEIRSQARSAETDALAAALTSACLQVPVDVASLRANLQRARGVLEREEADDAAKAAAANVRLVPEDAPANQKPPGGALINMVYTDGVAASLDAGYSIDDDEPERMDPLEVIEIESVMGDGAETDGETEATPAAAAGSLLGTMEDIDRFGAKTSGESGTAASGLAALRAAVTGAEAALEAVELEEDLRVTIQDQGSLDVAAVPKLEALMLRAAKVAERKPPLTQEGAAKLNTLVSRCFSRATALQEMEGARAALAEALEPSLRGRDLAPGSLEQGDVPRLEKAVARARTSAWPWQLEDAVADAESILERWRALAAVDSAMKSRSVARLRDAIGACGSKHPSLDLSDATAALSELDAERAMEDGDQRLRTYFAASKVAWAGGVLTDEAAAMLTTIRQSLDITDAEHEQVTRAASAGSRTPEEAAAARSKEALDTQTQSPAFDPRGDDDEVGARIGGPGQRVSFSASGEGVRRPMFEGSEDVKGLGANDPDVESLWAGAVPDEGSAGEEITVTAGGPNSTDGSGGAGGPAGKAWRRVGDTIIYNEEEIIGVGSSGTYVFRGYVQHTTRARHAVAVKRIQRPPGEEGRELLKLVEREVELLTALNQSPKVPFFHCWGITSSHVFIALELCTESLREHVTRRGDGMSVERRMDILRSVSSGIQWLHDPSKPSGCITHNDLKPENLLVDSVGEVKIADVGLGVQLQNTGKSGDKYTMSTFRKYGIDIVLAGRAPEMLKHQPLTPAADIWAMGVVFYFVLTGRASPFSESGRDVPTDAAIINGRHHLQNLMRVNGLHPRRALEARHLLASMLAPDPASRPDAAGVCAHPLFWDDERAMQHVSALHARSATVQREMSGVLNDIATDALLSGATSGNSERGALLAAASMDLTDWKRMVDPGIRDRITKHLVKESPVQKTPGTNGANGKSKADVGRKPYGDGFADLLRFCRNAYEHPPTGDEIGPIVDVLVDASAALASQRSPENFTENSDAAEENSGRGSYEPTSAHDTHPSLLPQGVVQGMAYRRLTRRQRRALFAAYVAHLFPGLPLAVHECTLSVGVEPTREEKREKGGKNGGANKGAKQRGGVAAQQGTKAR
jgi:serine/threonine protein kinase